MCEGDGCACEGCACEGCECGDSFWYACFFCCATQPVVVHESEPKQKREEKQGPTPPLVMLRPDEAKYQVL